MPVIGISVKKLNEMVGKKLDGDTMVTTLQQLGCDVEGYAVVVRYRCPKCDFVFEIGEHEDIPALCDSCGMGFREPAGVKPRTLGTDKVVRMELLPVRPDMFDVGGLARAVRGYLGIETGLPLFKLSPSGFTVKVDPQLSNRKSFRPIIACAVVRNLIFDDETIKIIMKMQENLHWAIGRDRLKASIGVYDLDRLEPNFRYRAVGKDEITFLPLGGMPDDPTGTATPQQILDTHPKGVAYAHLLKDFDKYPLLEDSKGNVLSMPPIINSEDTRVQRSTKNVIIDVTGPTWKNVTNALNVIVCSLAELGGELQSVEIHYPDKTITTPDLNPASMELVPENAPKLLGVELSNSEVMELLHKMRFGTRQQNGKLIVDVPAYRSDIMHEVDLIEDVAIAYGFHRVEQKLVPTMTVGKELETERISGLLRRAMVGLGFLEIMSLMLTDEIQHFKKLRLDESDDYVKLQNPASSEQTLMRQHLFTGILETFSRNRSHPTPQKIFEIGDISWVDESAETGIETSRRLAAAIMDPKTGFADIKAVIEAVAHELDWNLEFEPKSHPSFIEGRCAELILKGSETNLSVGVIGEVHPEVLENLQIVQPVGMAEILVK